MVQSGDFRDLMNEVDVNGDGGIDLEEFVGHVGGFVGRVVEEHRQKDK